MSQMLMPMARIAARHERTISIVGGIWFWAGIAVYANFIELPDVPEMVRQGFFWLGVAANAVWWGFLRPKIEAEKKRLESDGVAKLPESGS